MKKYCVVGRPLFLQKGTLALTEQQYKPRKRVLRPIRGNRYEITGEVCFKIGETIGYEGDADVLVRLGYLEPEKKKQAEDVIQA